MRIRACSFLAVALGLIPQHDVLAVSKADTQYIQQVANGEARPAGLILKKGKNGWWARAWTKTDGNGFYGRPRPMTDTENQNTSLIIRYTRFSTEYDVEFQSPLWGAYTINSDTLANEMGGERTASNPDFERPNQFFQEPLVVAESQKLGITPASHGTFTSTFDPRFPMLQPGGSLTEAQIKDENAARAIQRGHMVPNNAMKNQGSHEDGQTAQIESFSVANIVPQMAKSNAPTWSTLEDACFNWAHEIGQVWLIVGPVYHNRESATYIKKVKTGAEQDVPSPDELFYVVIGKRSGKTSAIGFLLPHEPTQLDYKVRAVAVDEIERKTGLNFMPDLTETNDVEGSFDQAWLITPPRKIGIGNPD